MTLSKGNRLAKLKQAYNSETKKYDTLEPREIVDNEMSADFEVVDLSANSQEYDPETKTNTETVFVKLRKVK
jgi:hypothetical protein